MRDHNCYPVFLKNDLLVNHNGFCNFFWPLAHFVLTPSSNTEFKQVMISSSSLIVPLLTHLSPAHRTIGKAIAVSTNNSPTFFTN